MKGIQLIVITLCFLWSCQNNSTKKEPLKFDHLLTWQYNNEYNDGRLIKTIIIKSETYENTSHLSKYKYTYEYCKDKLTKQNQFKLDDNGQQILETTTNYSNSYEENIHWENCDTIRYQKKEYDSAGRLIKHIKQHNMSVPEFEFIINDNFEENIKYDSLGNITEVTILDYSSGKTQKKLRFYNTTPTVEPSLNLDIIYFHTDKLGDTLITKRYCNGNLEQTTLEIKKTGLVQELTYNSSNKLLLSQETITQSEEKWIEVIHSSEFNTTDSIYYLKNKEIKSVSISPESKTIILSEYDKYENLLTQKHYTFFL